MKNWFVSNLLLLLAAPAFAASAADGLVCLEASDITCAEAALADDSTSPEASLLRARLSFNLGNFDDAVEEMEAVSGPYRASEAYTRELEHMRATQQANDGFATETRGDVTLRYLPGLDRVLIDEAFETLQAAHDRIGPMLGGAPPGGVRMEIYPSAERFIAASGLPPESVRTTGVVALSKWTRLLITSPRALGRGYAWKDTIAHEYIHYIVAWRTLDRTPVWLQEGIARSHEAFWRLDTIPELPPYQQGLLANALSTDTMVPLERMHPSMAFLDSAEQASQAFAQVSTMVQYLRESAGEGAVSSALDRVRNGEDALQAVAGVGADGDVEAFMEGWKTLLRGMNLISRKLEAMPTLLGPADDEFSGDPVLARRKDLAGYVRLGDLLRDAGRADAALIEYRKAIPEDEPPSPTLSARLAQTLVLLGKEAEAMRVLQASVADYPEFALTRKELGGMLLKQGKVADALEQYRMSADVNPFDPEVQASLGDLYAATGQRTLADRHTRYHRILTTGGGQ